MASRVAGRTWAITSSSHVLVRVRAVTETWRSPCFWKKIRAYPLGSRPINTPVPNSGCVTRDPAVHSGEVFDMKTTDLLGAFGQQLEYSCAGGRSVPYRPREAQEYSSCWPN